jgi:hypothetical protein
MTAADDGDYLDRMPIGLLRAFHAQAVVEARKPGSGQELLVRARDRLAAAIARRSTHRGETR